MKPLFIYDDEHFQKAWQKSQAKAEFESDEDAYEVFVEGWNACFERLTQDEER